MNFLAMFLVCLGCIVIGMALATRALAHHHERLEVRRLQLDLAVRDFRREQAQANAENVKRENFERVVRRVIDENRPNRIGPSPGPAARKAWLM